VYAFVPDSEELAAAMHKSYGPLRSWEAKMTFPDYPGVTDTVWFFNGKWRQEWGGGDTAKGVGNKANVVAACTSEPFALTPLLVWMPSMPLAAWKSWGIDVAVGNYGFYDNTPCLMLGAAPGDQAGPSVVLNNETMAPLMVRYGAGAKTVTVEFGDYRIYAGYPVPQKLTVHVGEETLEATVKWIRLNDSGNPELYERDLLDVTPCAEPPMPYGFFKNHFRYPGTH